jgi:hypothetical protein
MCVSHTRQAQPLRGCQRPVCLGPPRHASRRVSPLPRCLLTLHPGAPLIPPPHEGASTRLMCCLMSCSPSRTSTCPMTRTCPQIHVKVRKRARGCLCTYHAHAHAQINTSPGNCLVRSYGPASQAGCKPGDGNQDELSSGSRCKCAP